MWPFSRRKPIKAYWWNKVTNFGDALAPLLLRRFADLDEIEWSPLPEAEIVSVGSILDQVPGDYTGYVVGSGRHHESSEIKVNPKISKILALRGPLTAQGISGSSLSAIPGYSPTN